MAKSKYAIHDCTCYGQGRSHEEDVLVIDRGGCRPAVMRRMYLLWTGAGTGLQS